MLDRRGRIDFGVSPVRPPTGRRRSRARRRSSAAPVAASGRRAARAGAGAGGPRPRSGSAPPRPARPGRRRRRGGGATGCAPSGQGSSAQHTPQPLQGWPVGRLGRRSRVEVDDVGPWRHRRSVDAPRVVLSGKQQGWRGPIQGSRAVWRPGWGGTVRAGMKRSFPVPLLVRNVRQGGSQSANRSSRVAEGCRTHRSSGNPEREVSER